MENSLYQLSEAQKAQYRAFWERKPGTRATMYLTSWDGSAPYRAPQSVEEQWGDLAYREAAALYHREHVRFHAEGFSSAFVNFGPGCLTAMIGGSYRFAPQTVWFENQPFAVPSWEEAPALRILKDSEMYRMVENYTRRLLSHKDRIVTSITDIGGTFDIIAAMRGTENLLYDMYDSPDEIKAFLKALEPVWKEYFLLYSSRLLKEQGAMTSWMPIWSDKSYYPLQCDYCAMLSPDMFREFILPDLAYQTGYMDRAIYHLDGPGELPHVDMLLSLPRLSAIQWTSGDGNAPIWDPCWFDLYRRILGAGKGLILLGVRADEMENLFRAVGQSGIYLTSDVRDEADARDLVAMADRLIEKGN